MVMLVLFICLQCISTDLKPFKCFKSTKCSRNFVLFMTIKLGIHKKLAVGKETQTAQGENIYAPRSILLHCFLIF